MKTKYLETLILMLALAGHCEAAPMGTAFTYQGKLNDGGLPANGSYDFFVVLMNGPFGAGSIVSGPVYVDAVPVNNGLFTMNLDFGAGVFDGVARWLNMHVRTNSNPLDRTGYELLLPWQEVKPAPYSLYAARVAPASIDTAALAPAAVTADEIADGAVVRSVNGLTEMLTLAAGPNISLATAGNTLTISGTGGGLPAWLLGGNGGTDPAVNFLGTTDNTPLTLRVNNQPAFRIAPQVVSPNFIAGHPANAMSEITDGSAVLSGGTAGDPNGLSGSRSVIVGGQGNTNFSAFGFLGGGQGNRLIAANNAVLAGGSLNRVEAQGAFLGGGANNVNAARWGVLAGGEQNTLAASAGWAAIGGGFLNRAEGLGAIIAGGSQNRVEASGADATIAGGFYNVARSLGATVGGGRLNATLGEAGTTGGGTANTNVSQFGTIGGGQLNHASSIGATVGGGIANINQAAESAIGGGALNVIRAGSDGSAIAGGRRNEILYSSPRATISGGEGNLVLTNISHVTIGGGATNVASARFATIGGGAWNNAYAPYSTIPGGHGAAAWNYGQQAGASGYFTAPGDAQVSTYVLRGRTQNNSQGDLHLDGATAVIRVPENSIWAFRMQATALQESGAELAAYEASGVVTHLPGAGIVLHLRDGAGATITTAKPLLETASAVSWQVTPYVNLAGSTGYLRFAVNGSPGQGFIRWVATIQTTELMRD